MCKINKRAFIITGVVTILPIFIGLFLWDQLPDAMAVHFNNDGMPNEYRSKFFAVLGLPSICLALHCFGLFITVHDPKKQNINPEIFHLIMWFVPVISLFTAGIIYPYNLGYEINIAFAAKLFVGAVLLILGNYLPKARQNYTIGIKLPWALDNEVNWNKTHRLAGYLWFVCGVLIILLTFAGMMPTGIMIAIVSVIIMIPSVYSYFLYMYMKKD